MNKYRRNLTVLAIAICAVSCRTLEQAAEAQTEILDQRPGALLAKVYHDLAIIRGVKELWAGEPLTHSGPTDLPARKHSRDDTPPEAHLARFFRDKKMPSPPVGRYVINPVNRPPEFRVTVEDLDAFFHRRQEVEQSPAGDVLKAAPEK